MNRVLIIGRQKSAGNSPIIDQPIGLGYSQVIYCSTRREFIAAVMEASRTQPIELLDIFDHGAPGAIEIGDEILINLNDPNSIDVTSFESLHHYLAPTACVRLLGCNTAVGTAGRRLLLKLADTLGEHRTVFGTIDRIEPFHFGPDGFALELEALFSSLAAIDAEAPTSDVRQESILDVVVPIVEGHLARLRGRSAGIVRARRDVR